MNDPLAILNGRSIMVVDDSRAITSLLRDVFTSCGAKVTCVHCGRSAMFQLRFTEFDLLVLDLKMPQPDGWDVLAFLKLSRPYILQRTILLTGYRYHGRKALNVDGTCVPAVFKPFDVDELRQAACDRLHRGRTSVRTTG